MVLLTEEQLKLKQEEMQLRSTIRRSKQQSRNRMGKFKPRTEQEQLASTRASTKTLIGGKMAQPSTDSRSFCYLLHYRECLSRGEKPPTWKEFYSYLPEPGEYDNDQIIQIRDPQSTNVVSNEGTVGTVGGES